MPILALASATETCSATVKQSELEIVSSVLVKVRIQPCTRCHRANLCVGGWNPETGEYYKEINAQIDQAFKNCDLNLKDAGGKGWSQVFRVNSYHVPLNNEAIEAMIRNFKEWMPDCEPIWTCVGVTRLGEDDMRVEIEVVAHDEQGAAGGRS
jgi:enamine deaminase RidA (YjgF/YER057c/UK114 family)